MTARSKNHSRIGGRRRRPHRANLLRSILSEPKAIMLAYIAGVFSQQAPTDQANGKQRYRLDRLANLSNLLKMFVCRGAHSKNFV
jgi:hypothetical protein